MFEHLINYFFFGICLGHDFFGFSDGVLCLLLFQAENQHHDGGNDDAY